MTEDLARVILKPALNLANHSHATIRKKAAGLLAAIARKNEDSIAEIAQVAANRVEQESSLIVSSCYVSLAEAVLTANIQVYPLFLKSFFQKIEARSNWLILRIFFLVAFHQTPTIEFFVLYCCIRSSQWIFGRLKGKQFYKILKVEPRMKKRIAEPVRRHLSNTGAKSVEDICLRITFDFLNEETDLVEKAEEKIKDFLLKKDKNRKPD